MLPSITKQVSPDPRTIGEAVTWTVRVTVPKNLQYYDVTVDDTVPDGFVVDGYSAATCDSGCPGSDGPIVTLPTTETAWFLGDLAPSSSDRVYTLKLLGHLADAYAGGADVEDGDTLTNRASVLTNRTDKITTTPTTVPGGYDHTVGPATAVSHVVEPKLSIDKSADKGPYVEGGDTVTYTIKVKNTGSSPAYDVVVDDEPDVELTDVTLGTGAAYNTDPWSAGNRAMSWTIPGPIAVGDTVTLTYTGQVIPGKDLTRGQKIDNTAEIDEYFGVPEADRDTGADFREYNGPDSSVRLTVALPELTIVKTPDDKAIKAGQTTNFTITVKNVDARATAHGVVVHDVLDAGLIYTPGTATAVPTAGFSETGASGQTIDWSLGTLAPGASVTITVPIKVSPSVDDPTRLVNNAATHADEVPTPVDDDGSLVVGTEADLQVEKRLSTSSPLVPGTELTYRLVVTNNGPSDARHSTLSDVLPAELTYVSDDSAECAAAGQHFTCDFGTLAPGATRTIHLVVKLDPAHTSAVTNHVRVDTDTPETTETNNDDEVTHPVTPRTDVSIKKTSDRASYDGGDLVTYQLVVRNDGPSTARNVAVGDPLPSDVTFQSVTPGSPTCTQSGGHVACSFATLAPGQSKSITIVTKAKGTPPVTGTGGHQLTIDKAEQYVTLQAGEGRTQDLTCPAGGYMSDGAAEIMHVDQGTGSPADVRVQQASSITPATYRFHLVNTTTGQAQVKLFGTCLPATTEQADGHAHGLVVGGTLSSTAGTALAVGRHTFSIPVAAGTKAVAPGLVVGSGVARLVRSEPTSGAWEFTVEVLQQADVTLSLRQLSERTASGGTPTHQHRLEFKHVVVHTSLPVGESVQRVGCPVGYKGITATYDLPHGVVSLGHEPQPNNRDFRLLNTNSGPVDVMLDLECVAIETSGPLDETLPVVNTATVSSATFDTDPTNNSDSASI
ncbi:MAG: hypothetical protein WBP61_10420, partial [Nocardioides sp.]